MKRRGLTFYLKIYFKILKQDVKTKMSYRLDFLISLIGIFINNIAGYFGFWIIFQNFPSINGWTYNEMLFLYGFSIMALTPVQSLFGNNWNLKSYVYNGDFIKFCFRPINIFFYYMAETINPDGIGQFFLGLGTVIYAWRKIGLGVNAFTILLLIVYLCTASLFMIAIINISAATNFWFINYNVILNLAFKFREYAKYPISIFNFFFRIVFTYIIPIGFIAYYPGLVFLRKSELSFATFIAPVYGVFFFYISYRFWMLGARKYSGTGS